MAYNATYDNNKQAPKRVTVNSPYSFSNPVSAVDPTRLSAAFWNRMLKLTITPRATNTASEDIVWDRTQYISAHLTHTKAYMLANEIRNYLKDPVSYNSSGVLSNKTLVTISNGSEFGATGHFIVIRNIKVDEADPTKMVTTASYSYEFNTGFHHSIQGYNEEEASFRENFEDYAIIEINQLLALLDNYVAATTNAIAYSVVDQLDYRMNQTDNMLKACANALGVETKQSTYNSNQNQQRRIPKNNASAFEEKQTFGSMSEAAADIFG